MAPPSVSPDEESASVVVVTPVARSVANDDNGRDTPGPDTGTPRRSSSPSPDENEDKDKDEDEEEKEKKMVGMMCDTKNLYQKWDDRNRFSWTEKLPTDLDEAAENDQTVKYAILVRNKKSYDSRKALEVDSIVVQSPLIKTVLGEVLDGYPGVSTLLNRLAFAAPFKPFVHRWDRLTAALKSPGIDDTTRQHCQLLYDVLYKELKDVISAHRDYIRHKVVSFEHIWTIFQPDSLIYASRYGKPLVVRQTDQGAFADHRRYGTVFQLSCDRVDWDGSRFGFDCSSHVVKPFSGTIPIADLDCFPLEFHPEVDAVRTALIARGRVFEALAGHHYKSYKGTAIEQRRGGPSRVSVESRVVVDAFAHAKWNGDQQLGLRSLTKVDTSAGRAVQAEGDDYDNTRYDPYPYDDPEEDRQLAFEDPDSKPLPLTEEQLLMCSPVVRGYALRTKKWLEFYVDSITDITFSDRVFDELVLPTGHKRLVLAAAQSQIKHKHKFDDVIAGKGKGIVMLLSGGPGIGKTLTAEAVAEVMRVPLFVMSSGDLGTSSWCVEDNLEKVLEMVAKWNAVLLLDECDVFLQSRSASDLDRNAIVGIFLRMLEYYEGILFLTTNRLDDIDAAFHSRIHLSLDYPDLDEDARLAVWNNFLARCVVLPDPATDGPAGTPAAAAAAADEKEPAPKHLVTDQQVRILASLELNGRQIKNLVKTANLLACEAGNLVDYDLLKGVLQVEGHMTKALAKAEEDAKKAAEAEPKGDAKEVEPEGDADKAEEVEAA